MKYLNKTIEYGLYLLVFTLPLQTRWIIKPGVLNNGPWEYGTYSLYGTDVLLILLLFLFVIYRVFQKKFLIFNFQFLNNFQLSNFQTIKKFQLTWLLIGGLILVSATSIFFALSKLLAFYKFGWLILGAGLFWLLAASQYHRVKLVWSLLFGIATQALLAIWQFLFQATFQSKWLGLALHQASQPGTSVIETVASDGMGERWLRAYGSLDHPNILGGLMAVGILLLVGEVVRLEKFNQFSIFNFQFSKKSKNSINQPTDNFQTIFNVKIFKILSWSLLVIFTATLFFSFSRSAWLGAGLGMLALVLWSLAKRNLLAEKALAQAMLIIGAVALVLFLLYPNLVMTRLYPVQSFAAMPSALSFANAPNRLEIKSNSERIESIKNAWPIIKKYWAGGAGLGNYTLAQYNELKPDESSYYYQPAHNVFLLVWAETGIVGLILFIGLIVCLIIFNFPPFGKPSEDKQFSINQFSNNSLKIACPRLGEDYKFRISENDYAINSMVSISIFISLVILMSFDHWLWSLHFGVLFLWLALGLAGRVTHNS